MDKTKFNTKAIILLALFLAISIFIIILFKQNATSNSSALLQFEYKKSDTHSSKKRLSLNLNIDKIDLPMLNKYLDNDSSNNFPRELANKIKSGTIQNIQFDYFSTIRDSVCQILEDGQGEISTKKCMDSLIFKADRNRFSLDLLEIYLKSSSFQEELIARKPTGEWLTIPKIMGFSIPKIDDPYMGQILNYIRNFDSFPQGEISLNQSWDNNLKIRIPVDSLSSGQAKGYIEFTITNLQKLEKIQNNIAHIKSDLQIVVNWNVDIPEQGYTKLNFNLKLNGYRLFDTQKNWSYGSYYNGDMKIALSALNNQQENKFSASGKIELADKVK